MTPTPMPANLPEAFDEVAGTYDLMVSLSPGYHEQLRRSAAALVATALEGRDPSEIHSRPVDGRSAGGSLHLLDLGCGSGASTRALVEAVREAAGEVPLRVTGLDASAGMLRAARAKDWPSGVDFVQVRAEDLGHLPGLSGPERVDGVFAAYLLRNVADRDRLLRDVYGLLRPGAPVVLHEYSVAGNRRAQYVWTSVCHAVIVPLAWVLARRTGIYRYLWRSVMAFDSVPEVMARLQRAGFTDVRARSFPGWQHGIIHTVHGRRPQ